MLIELTEHKKHMKEHKKEKKQLQDELMVLQQTIREHQLPVIILFEGWSFSGKGTFISELMIHFDFRHLTMHNITPPTEEELRHRFYGVIGICSPKREKCLFWIAVGIRTFRHTHF